MNRKTEEFLHEKMSAIAKNIRSSAMAETATAISKVIYDKATDPNRSADEKLEDIIKFCEVSLRKRSEDKV